MSFRHGGPVRHARNRARWVDWDRPIIVVTAHRRESWGDGLTRIAAALREIVCTEHPPRW
jgi:UDP-N-acetylglucosamine 2-epimerase